MNLQSRLQTNIVAALFVLVTFAGSATGGPIATAAGMVASTANVVCVPGSPVPLVSETPVCSTVVPLVIENATTVDTQLFGPNAPLELIGFEPNNTIVSESFLNVSGALPPPDALDALIPDAANPVQGTALNAALRLTGHYILNETTLVQITIFTPDFANGTFVASVPRTATEYGRYNFTINLTTAVGDLVLDDDTIAIHLGTSIDSNFDVSVLIADVAPTVVFSLGTFPTSGNWTVFDNSSASPSFRINVTDLNGVGHVNATPTVDLRVPATVGYAVEGAISLANVTGTTNNVTMKSFNYTLPSSSRVKDGAYALNATFVPLNNAANTAFATETTFTVTNSAPTLSVASPVTTSFISAAAFKQNVTVSLDDPNWGGLGGRTVTELANLEFGRNGTMDALPAGITFVLWEGATTLTNTTGLATKENGTGALSLSVEVNGNNAVPAGIYTIFGRLVDDNGSLSSAIRLATIDVSPLLEGFNLQVEDGGAIQMTCPSRPAGCHPGDASTSASPLYVNVTGQIGASALRFVIRDFVGGAQSIPAQGNVTLNVTFDADGDGDIADDIALSAEVEVGAGGAAIVPFTGALANANIGGARFQVHLEFRIPVPAEAGMYTSASDVLGVPIPGFS